MSARFIFSPGSRLTAPILFLFLLQGILAPAQRKDPLSFWSSGPEKEAILDFVKGVTQPGGEDFVPPADRIAVFDFDGTMGCEKPEYMEVMVAVDQLCKTAQQQPALLNHPIYRAACDGNLDLINDSVYSALLKAFLDYPQSAYIDSVLQFTRSQIHPKFDLPYRQVFFAPMAQLVRYLRRRGFTVFLCSGSQQGFVRAYGEAYLGFQPWETIGYAVDLSYDTLATGKGMLLREDAFSSPSPDGDGKAILIQNRIGKAPILAFGNSMGDFEMLTYTEGNAYRNLELILVHDDEREYVYAHEDLEAEAEARGWILVSMKESFQKVFSDR